MRITDLALKLLGSTSGEQIVRAAAAASGAITLPAGTTDFSATGGAGQVVKQVTAGGPFTVGQLAAADVTGTLTGVTAGTGLTGGGTSGNPTISLSTPVSVANGGTGLPSGTSGGIPYYSAPGTIASSAALTANALVKGGGAGAAPIASSVTADASGNVVTPGSVTSGTFSSVGVNASLSFDARDAAGTNWFWYATGGGARLWRGGDKLYIGSGLMVGSAVGGDMGASTVNAVAVYAQGVALTSDARLKRDIAPLPDGCLDLVAAIAPKAFRHLPPPLRTERGPDGETVERLPEGPPGFYERRNWGFIAQDVKTAMDTAGHDFGGHEVDSEGNQYLSPSDLNAVLWKAVQELSARVTALEARSPPAG